MGLLQLGAEVNVKVIVIGVLQWHISVDFLKDGLRVMVHDKDIVNVAKDISVVPRVIHRVSLSLIP